MTEDQEIFTERYMLVMDGIREMSGGDAFGEPLRSFFGTCCAFLDRLARILDRSRCGGMKDLSVTELAAENRMLYEDIIEGNYDVSFANPDYIVPLFEEANIPEGRLIAQYLCFLFVQIRGLIPYAFEGRIDIFTIHAELFMEIYTLFRLSIAEGAYPEAAALRNIIYSFESDNCDIILPDSIADRIDPSRDFLLDIVCNEDLTSERYLYLSGEYVTDNEKRISAYLASLPEDDIRLMADTFTEGYRIGFVKAGKRLDIKTSVNIRYSLGFERVVRAAVENFTRMGLKCVIYRAGTLTLTGGPVRVGFYGAVPNRQYDHDHRNDSAIYLDADFVTRKLEVLEGAYKERRELAKGHAGPAVMEVFGEEPFTPADKETAVSHTDRTRKLVVDYGAKASQIVNRYIPGDERSFTIIAFPMPEIGDDFEAIFNDTVRLNTLPYEKYERIQQHIIDALDKAHHVLVGGKGDNKTELSIALHPLTNPEAMTNFENCVADVNIPVGEVFTSPQLSGTNGVLNVTKVYLNGLLYRNLTVKFTDGMITDYSCENYDSDERNRTFIKDNLLAKHETLPMGEFAIGTNTTAYRMARDHNIEGKLPILIGEKTGPHFAVGDTCYSHEEDVKVYNPDGKEIIARENEISAKRDEDPSKAYFQCHTDITIPYDELGYIRAVTSQDGGAYISIIEDGRFVLEGTEELNIPLTL